MKLTSMLPEWNCTNARVIVRADLNVPLDKGKIINDLRLRALQPTLHALIKKQATIILLTHLGRPHGHDAAFSTYQLIPWFKHHNYSIIFAPDIATAHQESLNTMGSIILLENLRFFPGEQTLSESFAHELAQLGDYFVQDAFGALHKNETSITLLPNQFSPHKRTIGLLIQKELTELSPLLNNPEHPLCLIIGGAKIADKIPLIEHMQDRADSILLCPAIVFSFLMAQGKSVGISLVDEKTFDLCKKIMKKNNLVFPQDYQVAHLDKNGKLSYTKIIGTDQMGISIGPDTIKAFSAHIARSKTIFFNGAMGFLDRPETLSGMNALFQAMAHSSGKSIIAGGDSTAAYEQCNTKGPIYLSTGGGAAIAYLSGQPLPGLMPFN